MRGLPAVEPPVEPDRREERRHGRAWVAFLGLGAVGGLLYLAPTPVRHAPWLFNLLGLAAAVAIVIAVRLHRPAHPLPWYLFAAGQALFVAGDVIAYNYQWLFHTELPFPSIADALYLAVYPCLMAGLLILIRAREPRWDRTLLIDSLIIAVGAGLLSWVYLMAPYAQARALPPSLKLISIAYPLMDLLLLAVVIRLAVGAGRREPVFYLLNASVVALLATDAVYGWILLHGTYQTGDLLDGGWIAFYLLWGAAALHPSMRSMEEAVPDGERRVARSRLLVLGGAALIAPGVQILQVLRGRPVDPIQVSVFSSLVFVLVLIRLNGLMVDVNQYRRTERRLRETERKYRSLVEGLPAVVYIAEFGDDGRWLYVSPQIETILGYTRDEWMDTARLWIQRLHPDDREKVLANEAEVLASGERLKCEYRVLARGGRIVWIREEAEILLDDEGQPMYLHGVMHDVSDQKLAEEQIREALEREQAAAEHLRSLDEMKNSFLQAVSHDLRTPLTTIMGLALTMERDDGGITAEEGRDFIGRIARNARKLNRLLMDLLDLDRLSRGAVEPNRETVELDGLVRSVVEECDTEDRPVRVVADAVEAFVDPVQVERIVENLVTNSVKYTPPGTRIWVKVARQGDGALLVVEDSGPGVPEEIRPTIFEAFRQGDDRSRGVGIGLALVAKFAELHGGRAWVEDREGGGASFKVTLPNREPVRSVADGDGAATGFGLHGRRARLGSPS